MKFTEIDKLVKQTIAYIEALYTDANYLAIRDEDPYHFDMCYADDVQNDIDYIVETISNPALVCYYDLHKVAKKYDYNVKALECELAYGQLSWEQ